MLPRTATLIRLAHVLGLSTDLLLGRANGLAAHEAAAANDIRVRSLVARLEQSPQEDLRFLLVVLLLLQRWRKEAALAANPVGVTPDG